MKGYHVVRRFGWDTHGVPIEYQIDKKFGVSGPDAVRQMGIEKYNAECKAIVMTYAQDWKQIMERLGRWVDMDNDYKVRCHSDKAARAVLTVPRPWIRHSWRQYGGCSSSSSIKTKYIEHIASCHIPPPSAHHSVLWRPRKTKR